MKDQDIIKNYIIENYESEGKINLSTNLIQDEIIDSYGIVDLVSFLETEFKIKFKETEILADNFESINRIVNFIHSKKND